jgi:hypothetical protein
MSKRETRSPMKSFAAILFMLLASACATAFERPSAPIDFGSRPPKTYQDKIKQHMETSLFDPFSAVYRFEGFICGYANQGLLKGGGVAWTGWAARVLINSKNRMGGYVGFKEYLFLLRKDGSVQGYFEPRQVSGTGLFTEQLCPE